MKILYTCQFMLLLSFLVVPEVSSDFLAIFRAIIVVDSGSLFLGRKGSFRTIIL